MEKKVHSEKTYMTEIRHCRDFTYPVLIFTSGQALVHALLRNYVLSPVYEITGMSETTGKKAVIITIIIIKHAHETY